MSSTDSYREWDAAYVLGALSAAERHAYEDHLHTCRSCRQAVAELATLPGLLTQVPFGEIADSDLLDSEPMPPDLLPKVRRLAFERSRRRVVLAAVAAAALLLGGFAGVDPPDRPATRPSTWSLGSPTALPSPPSCPRL